MRKLAAILCLALLISVVGCGSQPSTDANATTAATEGNITTTAPVATDDIQQPTLEQEQTSAQDPTVAHGTIATTQGGQTTTKAQATTNKPTVATTTKGQPQQTVVTTTKPKIQVDTAGLNVKNVGGQMLSLISGRKYTLKWIDDFTGTKLNTKYWTPENSGTYYNGELNYKTPDNIVIENDMMTIYGKKEEYKGKQYTGASMTSHNKVEYKYGKIEMLAKLPYGKGMWPAFWTMGIDEGWPWCGEIDIMEMVGDSDGGKWNFNGDSRYYATIHWCKPGGNSNKDKKSIGFGDYKLPGFKNDPNVTGIEKLADKFHVYGIEWTNTKIIAYFDDIKVGEVDITDPEMSFAFHQPHYMLVNLSIGGGWPGAPDASTIFPQKYIIDWIKIWQ